MVEDRRFGIRELVQLSGVPRRTVRYYVQRGLLPPPKGAGRGHYYTREHLERLLRIRELQQRGLVLDEIRELLEREDAWIEAAAASEVGPERVMGEIACWSLARPSFENRALRASRPGRAPDREDGLGSLGRSLLDPPARELVTRIRVGDGLELLVSHGAQAPTPSQVRALAREAERILGTRRPRPSREKKEEP